MSIKLASKKTFNISKNNMSERSNLYFDLSCLQNEMNNELGGSKNSDYLGVNQVVQIKSTQH